MKIPLHKLPLFGLLLISSLVVQCGESDSDPVPPPPSQTVTAKYYLTKMDQSVLFAQQDNSITNGYDKTLPTLEVKKATTFQTMDGFGLALTGGSALHLSKMSEANRSKILTELFATNDMNIGISYLRISIGASDLDEFTFSYDDVAAGETDMNLEKFTIDQDRKYLIPVIKEILAINPDIKFMASPWSAPAWMKTNGATKGGSLKPECYEVYAQYFVKYIEEMASEGINISAITVQNEPLHPGNNPSMYKPAEDQAAFIKNNLGPAFKAAGITTKIIIYDHNCDRVDYPMSVLHDADARQYIDGSAFHLYGGSINDISALHTAYPDKNLYFTEQWTGANSEFGGDLSWHTENIMIGGPRNWCKAVIEWNLAANSQLEPHTPGGCTECLGALTIDGNVVKRNVAYYIVAHASKFVRPGSVRIESNSPSGLINVAYLTADKHIVVIVLNNSTEKKSFNIKNGDDSIVTEIEAASVATYVL